MNEVGGQPPEQDNEVQERIVVEVGEWPVDELYGNSGKINPDTGKPMTLLDFLTEQEAKEHGGRIITHISDRLSDAAKKTNEMLHTRHGKRRAYGTGAFIMGVIAIRVVKKHHEKGSGS